MWREFVVEHVVSQPPPAGSSINVSSGSDTCVEIRMLAGCSVLQIDSTICLGGFTLNDWMFLKKLAHPCCNFMILFLHYTTFSDFFF